jgi:predicted Zn-dependent protease
MKHFYIVLFLGLSMHISTFAADERTIIRYVERVQAKLLRAAESANFKTSYIDRRISLDESKEVNANSGVTLNYGMLNYIQSEDELAGLLGHEVAHNLVEYDDDERIESEYFADRLGSFLAAKSGYNPYGLQVLLERIAHDP